LILKKIAKQGIKKGRDNPGKESRKKGLLQTNDCDNWLIFQSIMDEKENREGVPGRGAMAHRHSVPPQKNKTSYQLSVTPRNSRLWEPDGLLL